MNIPSLMADSIEIRREAVMRSSRGVTSLCPRPRAGTMVVLLSALCGSAMAVPVYPGDEIVVALQISYSDAADPGEGEDVVVESSGGHKRVYRIDGGNQVDQWTATVPNETVTVTIVGADNDEVVDYDVIIVPSVMPPPPPPPAPVPPPPPPPPPPIPPTDPDPLDFGGNGGDPRCNGRADPVNVLTGNQFQAAVDYAGGEDSGLDFRRYYNSSPWDTSVKPGWHHNFEIVADLNLTGVAGTSSIRVHLADGRAVIYTAKSVKNGQYTWASQDDPTGRLESSSGLYSYVSGDDIVYTFQDRDGVQGNGIVTGTVNAIAIQRSDGYLMNLAYLDTGTLAVADPAAYMRVTDSFGRSIQIADNGTESTAGDRVPHAVTLPDSLDYGYTLLFDDMATPYGWYINRRYYDGFPFGPTYFYGESSLAPAGMGYALTGIYDANGIRFANIAYDSTGRNVMTEHAGGVEHTSIVYKSDGTSVVTDSHGPMTYARAINQGLARNAGVSQAAGAGCSAANSASTYDANSNVLSTDNFNAHRSCFAYEGRNLRTVAVDGLPNTTTCSSVTVKGSALPAGSRKTSTQWHPNWRKPVLVAEPTRMTTYVYNGQVDSSTGQPANCVTATYRGAGSVVLATGAVPIAVLCKRVEQATTDTDGSKGFAAAIDTTVPSRSWSYTYTELGQKLTEIDPNLNSTTYAYYTAASTEHSLGDLMSVTDALGHTTSYESYDRAGRMTSMKDPNGVVTQFFYQAPGRLYAMFKIVNPDLAEPGAHQLTTQYQYDAEGQLTRVTRPDGSFLSYEHDPAHRLIAIADNLGNRIEYQLDNDGVRKGEIVKDSGGNIARTLSRSIDALGRVQQQTGQ